MSNAARSKANPKASIALRVIPIAVRSVAATLPRTNTNKKSPILVNSVSLVSIFLVLDGVTGDYSISRFNIFNFNPYIN